MPIVRSLVALEADLCCHILVAEGCKRFPLPEQVAHVRLQLLAQGATSRLIPTVLLRPIIIVGGNVAFEDLM
ncbi:MAG: hypothetical protein ACREVK_06650 [Gammaproteobacteria bacterium]